MRLQSTSISGFARLWALARLRRFRRASHRFVEEQRAIEEWLLITGSVITAGDARKLLGPAGGQPQPEPTASQPARHSFTAGELS